ncbi:MAG: hypothetical protein AAFQ82_28015, partial [Myxococcota bacterium]
GLLPLRNARGPAVPRITVEAMSERDHDGDSIAPRHGDGTGSSEPIDPFRGPRAPSAADSVAHVHAATERPPLEELRDEYRSGFQKFWFALGRGFNAIGRVVHGLVSSVADAAGVGATAAVFVLASPSLLFGSEPQPLWNRIRRVTEPTFDTLGGVADGVLQWPLTAIGVGLGSLRNLASFQWARSRKGAIETVLQPLIGTVMTVAQPLLFGFKELSDSLGEGRALSEASKAELRNDFSEDLLDSARFYDEPTLLHGLMSVVGGVGAFTVGDDVYAFQSVSLTTERHELIHSTQYREALGGRVGFLADYWADLLSNAVSMDPFTAYLNTRAEQEAYALENDPNHHH